MSKTEPPQTWRCLIDPCTTRGQWMTALGTETAEDAWNRHMRTTHRATEMCADPGCSCGRNPEDLRVRRFTFTAKP